MDRFPGQYPFEDQPSNPENMKLLNDPVIIPQNSFASFMDVKMPNIPDMQSPNVVDYRKGGAPLPVRAGAKAQELMGNFGAAFGRGMEKLGLGAPKPVPTAMFSDDIEAYIRNPTPMK